MIKNRVIIGFVCLLLFFSACSTGSDGTKESAFPSIGSGSSSKGISGVSLEFAEGNPPTEVFKDQPFNFAFVFRNYQEHEIKNMLLRTKGFDRGFVTGLQEKYTVKTLPKATEQTGPGLYAGLVVQGVRLTNFEDSYHFNPTFDYCYAATTTFREQICVPSDKNQCDITVDRSQKLNGPVSVTIDRVNVIGAREVRVDFTLNNQAAGKVVNTCFNDEEYSNEYRDLTVKMGSKEGRCEAISGFAMIGEKSNFYCTFTKDGEDSYASQVTVEFTYNYQQSLSKQFRVDDLNAGLR